MSLQEFLVHRRTTELLVNIAKCNSINTSVCVNKTKKVMAHTFADWFAVIPRTVFGTTDGG